MALLMGLNHSPIDSAGIYNNSGTVSADSISIVFYNLTVDGEPAQLASDDSVWVHFFYPDGTSAFDDSIAVSETFILEDAFRDSYMYTYRNSVDNIDGSGVDGVYSYYIVAVDRGAGIMTPVSGNFQLYQTGDLHAKFDSLANSTDKMTLTDTSAAAIMWLSLLWGAGSDNTNAARQEIYPLNAYNKDSIILLQSPYAKEDSIAKIRWHRGASGSVDSITVRKVTPGP